jgi:hypothetical protein
MGQCSFWIVILSLTEMGSFRGESSEIASRIRRLIDVKSLTGWNTWNTVLEQKTALRNICGKLQFREGFEASVHPAGWGTDAGL